LEVARDKLADNGKGVVGMFGPLAEVLAFSFLTRRAATRSLQASFVYLSKSSRISKPFALY
jgi:hypothetical protein